jgi:hypothetical protein
MGVVIAHHLVWTPYGCWPPNDPRGSSSHEVLVEALAKLGELHYGRNPVRPTREQLREFHERATLEDMYRTIPYIENNPRKHGLPPQRWDFVMRYDGRLPGRWRR